MFTVNLYLLDLVKGVIKMSETLEGRTQEGIVQAEIPEYVSIRVDEFLRSGNFKEGNTFKIKDREELILLIKLPTPSSFSDSCYFRTVSNEGVMLTLRDYRQLEMPCKDGKYTFEVFHEKNFTHEDENPLDFQFYLRKLNESRGK